MNQRANEINLNEDQFERLKEVYIERYVNNMSREDLMEYVANDMYNSMDSLTELEIIDDISFYFEDGFDDIVSEVRNGDL